MDKKIALLTNAREYAGPPTAMALAQAGFTVHSHDDAFSSEEVRSAYEHRHPNLRASPRTDLVAFADEALGQFGRIDAVVSNDISKGAGNFFEAQDLLLDVEHYVNSLILEPVRLLRAVLPSMKTARSGSIVLVTSGAPLRNPAMVGPHGYSAARAGAHGLVRSLAAELAEHGIQINAVAPFLVYSETYFPSELGANDPAFAPFVEQMVPMKRFGDPEEIGRLIEMLASGSVSFVSGQTIAFSGAGC